MRADLELLNEIVPPRTPLPSRPGWAYAIGPSSNAGFLAVTQLQAAGVPVFRATDSFGVPGGSRFEAGTWIVPPTPDAERVLERVAYETGLVVLSTDHAPKVGAYRLKTPTRVGLWRVANNMPGGWMLWLFEQYGLDHRVDPVVDSRRGRTPVSGATTRAAISCTLIRAPPGPNSLQTRHVGASRRGTCSWADHACRW